MRTVLLLALVGCTDGPEPAVTLPEHPPMAEGIYAAMGEVAPYATAEQAETFERGKRLVEHRFTRDEGLGPAFNVTFCGACHERPTSGGSGGLYRNFVLSAVELEDGVQLAGMSAGTSGGVIRLYYDGADGPARPPVPDETNVFAQRNPIPFFGVGLIAELPAEAIEANADPDDADGDGISGRVNYVEGFVGRFGRKAQTGSIEGFIRGPLFNHAGITTDPLTDAQRAELPVDSSGGTQANLGWLGKALSSIGQAAANGGPLVDDDGVADPELTTDELFDIVSFSMLLGAPRVDPDPSDDARRGMGLFDDLGCASCHLPRLEGPRGPLPLYSDLLLHDMGEDLADHLEYAAMADADGAEFRTQPLWGIVATGPYLHDGRAHTLDEAIAWHGGEATAAREAWEDLDAEQRAWLRDFLISLGGADQASPGMIPPGTPIAEPGTWGGPLRALQGDEAERFEAGRTLFDRDFGVSEGVGAPRYNGDSCRACHFEPVVGGAGPRGVDVVRHGIVGGDGSFIVPAAGTVLHRQITVDHGAVQAQAEATLFERRNTPHLLGLGLVDGISEATILANADPDDLDGDGVSGRPSWTDGGRLGRFGWKAQVPSLREFVRDAATTELGMTLPEQPGLTFGRLEDNDGVPDPELTLAEVDGLFDFLSLLGPPPRNPGDAAAIAEGEAVFEAVGCATCHIPALEGADGPVPLYSDLLLHEVVDPMRPGIEDASAGVCELRTPPLWGVSHTGPWLHDGTAYSFAEAIEGHHGEAENAVQNWMMLDEASRGALEQFLESL